MIELHVQAAGGFCIVDGGVLGVKKRDWLLGVRVGGCRIMSIQFYCALE